MESDAESGFAEHWQVVGTVAHSNGLCQIHLLHLCYEFQKLSLAVSVNDFSYIASGKFSVLSDFEFVGINIVYAVFALEEFSEIRESSA